MRQPQNNQADHEQGMSDVASGKRNGFSLSDSSGFFDATSHWKFSLKGQVTAQDQAWTSLARVAVETKARQPAMETAES
jgi:hypothetical protein